MAFCIDNCRLCSQPSDCGFLPAGGGAGGVLEVVANPKDDERSIERIPRNGRASSDGVSAGGALSPAVGGECPVGRLKREESDDLRLLEAPPLRSWPWSSVPLGRRFPIALPARVRPYPQFIPDALPPRLRGTSSNRYSTGFTDWL